MSAAIREAFFFLVGVLIAAVIAASCGCGAPQRPALCVTACGMRLTAPVPAQTIYDGGAPDDKADYLLPWWSCDNVEAVEAASLEAYQNTAASFDNRFKIYNACEALDGVEIRVRSERHWFDKSNNESVAGLTHCTGFAHPWIEMGNREPGDGTLTHEMAHAIQSCSAKGPTPLVGQDPSYDADADPAHLNWERYGIYPGIFQVELIDVAATMRRDNAIAACAGDAGCVLAFDAGVFP